MGQAFGQQRTDFSCVLYLRPTQSAEDCLSFVIALPPFKIGDNLVVNFFRQLALVIFDRDIYVTVIDPIFKGASKEAKGDPL